MKYIIVAFAISLAACSGDTAKDAANNGWELGDGADAGSTIADAANGNNGGANNGTTGGNNANNSTTGGNNGTAGGNNATTGGNNATTGGNNSTSGSSNNTNTNNTNGGTTNTTGPGNGMGAEGDSCGINSDCGADLTCCPGFDGNATCESRCRVGGLCGGMDSECDGNRECCDLSGINQPDACLRNCPGGGDPGTACMANADCPSDEVCCQGFDGSMSCTADCFTGGVCDTDADCRNGQLCCDFQVAKACLDQCNF